MARAPVLAAGGIVLRQARPPLIAVVRLRKGEWVLPKGKLDDGETPRDAAMREVWEETGHDVSVHEFLGTLAYDLGGRSKIVHYWRMETQGRPTRDLTNDVRAVDWLPLRPPSSGSRAGTSGRFSPMSGRLRSSPPRSQTTAGNQAIRGGPARIANSCRAG